MPQFWGSDVILVWLVVLIVTVVVRGKVDYSGAMRELYWFESFYRTGSIIFGGGQVWC